LYKDITQDKCPYNIPQRLLRNKPYQSCSHINYIAIITYLLQPHKKTPIILYRIETDCPNTSPPSKIYTCGYTNKNNHYAHKKHSIHHIINTTPSKNKQTKILNNTTYITKNQPTLYPYITTYSKLTNSPPTQHQKPKINKKNQSTHPLIHK
jgi:hypothetical protein